MARPVPVRHSFTWTPPARVSPGLICAAFFDPGVPGRPTRKQVVGRYVNPIWVLDYVLTGGSDYRVVNDRRPWRPRRARTAHLYPPGTVYWERAWAGDARSSGYFLFNHGEHAGLLALTAGRENPHGFAEFEDPAEQLITLIKNAALLASQRGHDAFWDAQAMLCQTLGLLLASPRVDGCVYRCPAPEDRLETLAQRVDRCLRAHLHERVSLRDVARETSTSESTLTHAYRKQTGRSVAAAALDMRLDRARAMLLRGEQVKTIAQSLGFTDAFHLSRAFKRRLGVSPREYLASSRGK